MDSAFLVSPPLLYVVYLFYGFLYPAARSIRIVSQRHHWFTTCQPFTRHSIVRADTDREDAQPVSATSQAQRPSFIAPRIPRPSSDTTYHHEWRDGDGCVRYSDAEEERGY